MIVHRLPEIDKAIWKKAGDLNSPVATRKGQRGRASHATIPDTVVAEIRFMHECGRKSTNQVCAMYPQYSKTWIRNVLDYVLRPTVKASL